MRVQVISNDDGLRFGDALFWGRTQTGRTLWAVLVTLLSAVIAGCLVAVVCNLRFRFSPHKTKLGLGSELY